MGIKIKKGIKASNVITWLAMGIVAGILLYRTGEACVEDFDKCVNLLKPAVEKVEEFEEYGEENIFETGTGENLSLSGHDDKAEN